VINKPNLGTSVSVADDMEPSARESIQAGMDEFGLDPRSVAKTVCFALEQPQEVEIGSLTIRPTVQS
jgi:NADP-dependent 3-hydroxy acid dehydrogenase YdfG